MVNPQHTTPQNSADVFCSVLSREAGEPLIGTALHNDLWLLLEYDGSWGAKATSDNELPAEVQTWLTLQTAAVSRGRVQFIKQERERPRDFITFYVALAAELAPRLYCFQLAGYEALLDIDLMALATDGEAYDMYRQTEPIYLVCTNGRRDRCCALFGLEVYHNLQRVAGDAVWQTTHVGGHRFAANVLTFPDGTYYGRVHTGDIETFYHVRQRDEILLPHLRGRSCYEEVVQAADYYLRQETGQRGLQAFRYEGLESDAADHFEVTFVALESGDQHIVRLRRETLDLAVFASCGKPGTEPCYGYYLQAIEK